MIIYALWVVVLIVFGRSVPMMVSKGKLDPNYHLVIFVPAMNEAGVIARTITQFLKSTKHIPNVQMIIIDDDSTDGTADIVKSLIAKQRTNKVELLERKLPNAQTGKGNALNWAYTRLIARNQCDPRHLIVGVLDADAYMTSNGYRKILQYFSNDEELGLLQTKVEMIKTHNWLQILQDMEFVVINDWIQNTRNLLSNAAASGNGQCIRVSAIDTNEPWGNALLEDFEFSTRFLLDGKKTQYANDIVVYQEAVGHIVAFVRQRSRWVQGGLDCLVSYWTKIIKSSQIKPLAKVEMTFYMIIPFITLLTGATHIIVLIFVGVNAPDYWKLFVLLLSFNLIWSVYLSWKYWRLTDSKQYALMLSTFVTAPIYNYLLYVAIVIAFYKKIVGQTRWVKTAHGED